MIDLRELIAKGVHFGHQTWRGNPKMRPYIWGEKNGIHLIDVSKTAYQIEHAANFLKEIAAEGKEILWCGTKRAAAGVVTRIGAATNSPFVAHRWVGGTLTNHVQVKKSVTKLLHLEDVLSKSADAQLYTKKELGVFAKLVERAERNVGGIRTMVWPLGALIVVDVRKEHVAIREALDRGVPVVALVDTNGDPSNIQHVIPANDDSPDAINFILSYLAEAVNAGKQIARERLAAEGADAQKRAPAAAPEEDRSSIELQLAAVEASLEEGEAKSPSDAAARGARRPQQRGGPKGRSGGPKRT